MGDIPLKQHIKQGYNDDKEKFKPIYHVWKSQANGVYLALAFWYDTNVNEYKLKLSYVSDYAEEHFEQMAKLGVFGDSVDIATENGMEGL